MRECPPVTAVCGMAHAHESHAEQRHWQIDRFNDVGPTELSAPSSPIKTLNKTILPMKWCIRDLEFPIRVEAPDSGERMSDVPPLHCAFLGRATCANIWLFIPSLFNPGKLRSRSDSPRTPWLPRSSGHLQRHAAIRTDFQAAPNTRCRGPTMQERTMRNLDHEAASLPHGVCK